MSMIFGFFHIICPIGSKLGNPLGRGLVSPINLDRWSETNQGGNPCTVGQSEMLLTTILALRSERGTSSTRQNFRMSWPSCIRLLIFIINCRVQRDKSSYCDSNSLHSTRKVFFYMRFLGEILAGRSGNRPRGVFCYFQFL